MKQFIAFLLLFSTATSFSQVLQENMWVTNGTVYAVQKSGSTVYIGGQFTQVGLNIPYGAAISTGTWNPGLSYAKPNNAVRAAAHRAGAY